MTELSLHILDIVENSLKANATKVNISIIEDTNINKYSIEIKDNGKGMTKEELNKATDAFFTTRTTRNVGLGLPLFKQAIEQCGGNFNIHSEPGLGTKIIAEMLLNHIDRQPLGDISGVIYQLISSFPSVQFIYNHSTCYGTFILDSLEIKETLGEISVNNKIIRNFLKEMIHENLNEIKASN